MKILLKKYWKAGLTLLVGVIAFCFWKFAYPCALSYQEQFQLFLFDGSFFVSMISEPGGLARYMGEFLVQFYNNTLLGALIIAAIDMLLMRLTWMLGKKENHGISDSWYWLTLLPVIGLWFLMGDEHIMMTFVVAFMLNLLLMQVFPQGEKARIVYVVLVVPTAYWLLGPAVFMLAVYICIKETAESGSRVSGFDKGVLTLVYATACVVISASFAPYPLKALFRGVDYYRYIEIIPYSMYLLMLLCAVLPFVFRCLHPVTRNIRVAVAASLVILAVVLIPFGFDSKTYELMDYDYLVRLNNWNGIIEKAQKKAPDLPMSVCATNLALGMTDQLCDKAFDLPQHGTDGLLPPFQRDFTSQLITGEAYYQLGLVSTSQRFAFEAMEALPDYNKSGRLLKRLAETNLINGQYGVARKYLRILEKTMFYSKWAKRTEALIGDETAIENHPEYGRKRRERLTQDFLFSEREVDKIFGHLFLKNPQNRLAMEYLCLYPLLERNLNKFMQYVAIVNDKVQFNPIIVQQGVVMACLQQHQQPPQGMIDGVVQQQFEDYAHTFLQSGKDSRAMERFRNTAWYYLTVGNN